MKPVNNGLIIPATVEAEFAMLETMLENCGAMSSELTLKPLRK